MLDINLEQAWEGIQDIYCTHANIYAYRYGLKTFCSFGESTYIITSSKKKVAGYYNKKEFGLAQEKGLEDFLKKEWQETFRVKAKKALTSAHAFIEYTHLNSHDLTQDKLFEKIREGTDILNEVFTVFTATQPQYTSLLEEYVKNLLPKSLSPDEKNTIFISLTHSEKITPLVEEEIEWNKLILRNPLDEDYEKHARKYGLLRAADGQEPHSLDYLKNRARSGPILMAVESDIEKSKTEKNEIIQKYTISNTIIDICNNIAELGHIRLCLRLQGWMPLSYILISELFPQLPKFLPYSYEQLQSCIDEELYKIFKGDRTLTPQKLEERFEYSIYGLLNGEEFFWSGEEARKNGSKIIPQIESSTTSLIGQIGWKGKVTAHCYVLKWDAENLSKQIDDMPEDVILVVGQTRPQLMVAIKKAIAIVTDEGGLLSHAAIVSRELKKPSIIGTKHATKIFKTGDLLEVDAEKGIVRKI